MSVGVEVGMYVSGPRGPKRGVRPVLSFCVGLVSGGGNSGCRGACGTMALEVGRGCCGAAGLCSGKEKVGVRKRLCSTFCILTLRWPCAYCAYISAGGAYGT